MQKILMILLWPAGLAVIIGIGAVLASRARAAAGKPPAHPHARPHGHAHAHPEAHHGGWRGNGRRAAGGREAGPGSAGGGLLSMPSLPGRWLSGRGAVTRFLLTLLACVAAVYAAGALVGVIAVHLGPAIDKPIWHWTVSHQAHAWVSVMRKATQIAAAVSVAAAAATAAVCLVFVWRQDRWLPPAALAALIVVDHYLTMALTDTFNRVPPPHSGGTFPSGASDRAVAYYGLIAFLLWRAVSGRRRAAIWAATVVAALAFTEAYSRGYLVLHWFTDIAGGLVYGAALLTAFIVAVNTAAAGRAGGGAGQAVAGGGTGAYAIHAPGAAAAGTHPTGAPIAGAPFAGAPPSGARSPQARSPDAPSPGTPPPGGGPGPQRGAAPGRRIAGEGVA